MGLVSTKHPLFLIRSANGFIPESLEFHEWKVTVCFVKVDDVAIMPVVDAAPNVDTLGMNIVWGTQDVKHQEQKWTSTVYSFAKMIFVCVVDQFHQGSKVAS